MAPLISWDSTVWKEGGAAWYIWSGMNSVTQVVCVVGCMESRLTVAPGWLGQF